MISKYLIILMMHALADFVFQPIKMARLKRFSMPWLFAHVGVYTSIITIFTVAFLNLSPLNTSYFLFFNVTLHFVFDYITGQLKRLSWEKDAEGLYFGFIVIDQFIHLVLLFISYDFVVNHF